MAAAFGELSVSFFVLRLLGQTNAWKRKSIWIIIILTFVLTSVNCILMFVQCRPIEALWTMTMIPGAKCWDRVVYMDWAVFTHGTRGLDFMACGLADQRLAYMTLIAMILSLLPIAVIIRLQMETKVKLILVVVMGMGVLSVFAFCSEDRS